MKLHSAGMSVIALGLLLAAAVAQAQAPSVGRASRLTGEQVSSAQAPGAPVRKLAEGDSLFAGERIRTGAGTVLQIEFTDKSRFTLGPRRENVRITPKRCVHGSSKVTPTNSMWMGI